MVSRIKATGANVILMKLHRTDGLLSLLRKLTELFKELKPDVAHVQYLAPGLIPILAAKGVGIRKIVASVHQPGRPYGLKPKLFVRLASHLCDGFFCNSKSVEESWFGDSQIFDSGKIDPNRKHFTIYNGVDIDKIEKTVKGVDKENIKESLNVKNKKIIGVVGRLRKEKGQATLLKSMKIVLKELPDTVLLVVGDGPDRGNLERMTNELGINGCVKWLGQRDPDEVIELYSVMDIVAVPSLFEGFGLSAAEAMAAGKPVIASDVDGIKEVVQDNVTGYLIPIQDNSRLAERLIELLSNETQKKRMGLAGYQRVSQIFSMGLFTKVMLAAYHDFYQR
jgi:glycosyltransferase involved in cell wall biosynthesis